jgi:hypothetical protein
MLERGHRLPADTLRQLSLPALLIEAMLGRLRTLAAAHPNPASVAIAAPATPMDSVVPAAPAAPARLPPIAHYLP